MDLTETQKNYITTPLLNQELRNRLNLIPDRLAFKIGEVADVAEVKPYVLRYWESEFEVLNPKKSLNNQRMYSRHDVKMVLLIKKLLHEDRFSIEGAKKSLKQLRDELKDEDRKKSDHTKLECTIKNLKELLGDIDKMRKDFLSVEH